MNIALIEALDTVRPTETKAKKTLTLLKEWEDEYRGLEGLLKFAEIAEAVDMESGKPFKIGAKGWEWQLDLLKKIYQHKRLIILKARQMGVTWICALYALWKALFHPYTRTLIVSRNREQASMTLRNYIGELYRRLPVSIREKIKPTAQQSFLLRFNNGSEIITQPSTEDAGRGFTGALVILDEVAFQPYGELTYASIKPTVDKGGQLIMLSTAKGVGNFFHRMWVEAREGKNGFEAIFLPYYLHPERSPEWRERQRKEFPEEWMIAQEYPEVETEAFVKSGRPVFSPMVLETILREDVMEPIPTPPALASLDPFVQVFKEPEDGHVYVLGVDCAEGRIHGDLSTICVIDALTGEQVAEYASREAPFIFAMHIHLLSRFYQAARIIVEKNGVGAAVISKLLEMGVEKLYRDVRRRIVGRTITTYGWQTTVKNKPLIINELVEGVSLRKFKIRSKELVKEMSHYQRDDDGDTNAAPGATDDRIMAAALAWHQVVEWRQRGQLDTVVSLHAYRKPDEKTETAFLKEIRRYMEEEERSQGLIAPVVHILGEDVQLLI